jgi:hypothetical protein
LTFDSVDMTFWYAGIGIQAILILMLIRDRVFKFFPAFFAFLVFGLISDFLIFEISNATFSETFLRLVVVQLTADIFFTLAVWIELGNRVLKFNHASRFAWFIAISFTAIAAVLLWFVIHRIPQPSSNSIFDLIYVYVRQVSGILWVAILLASAWLSRLRRLRWPERELQIATGLAFTCMIDLAVNILHTHPFIHMLYRRLDQIAVAGYLCTICYWVLSFSKPVENLEISSVR